LTAPARRALLLAFLLAASPSLPVLAQEGGPPAGGAGGGPAGGGDEPAPPTEEEKKKAAAEAKADEVKKFLESYEDTLSKMTDEDAMAGLAKMKAWYLDAEVPEDAKKDILRCFGTKVIRQRTREPYLEAAAKALGEFADPAVVPILKQLTEFAMNQKVPIPNVASAGLRALGKIASPKAGDVKYLTDLLKGKDDFIADAARALGDYEKAPGAVRKEIFEDLLKISEGVFSGSEKNDTNMKRKWNIWGTDVVDAMKKLSKQNCANPIEFRKWFNNKEEGGGKNPRTWRDEKETK
jgi:hypothetical protein